jgi:hypothetical protein
MKLCISIITTILLISTTVLAYDITYCGLLKTHSTKQVVVELPTGKSTIEVWGSNHEKINCLFVDKGTGNKAFEAEDTELCSGTANLSLPAVILARITNNTDSDIDLSIEVKDNK